MHTSLHSEHYTSSTHLSKSTVDYDVSYEVSHLESMVSKHLKRLNVACEQTARIERELQSFLDDYYAQVGSYFEQLTQLRQQISRYEIQLAQVAPKKRSLLGDTSAQKLEQTVEQMHSTDMPTVPDAKGDEVEAEIKDIYRRLAKLYHPDVADDKHAYSDSIIQLLNQAYAKGNLWAMREMEHSLTEHASAKNDTPKAKHARLRERFEAIAGSLSKIAERQQRLEHSAAWRLKARVEKDAYLVEVVIHRVKQQIEEARQLLFRRKIEYKAVALL